MGLDIFFTKKHYNNIGYFRKVNFLVSFFEEYGYNRDNQEGIEVYKDTILDLLDRCNKVLEDNSKAKELLPTAEGFFFGSTEYDEYYFENVKDVKKYIEEVLLEEFDNLKDDEYITFSTWW